MISAYSRPRSAGKLVHGAPHRRSTEEWDLVVPSDAHSNGKGCKRVTRVQCSKGSTRGGSGNEGQPHQQLNAQMRGHLQLDGAAVERAEALIVHLDGVVVAGKGDLRGLPISATACSGTHPRRSNVSYALLRSAVCLKDQGWLQHTQRWFLGTSDVLKQGAVQARACFSGRA